ncbi:OLC1v1009295C1 [Oldenlandia corymbosa var. corymbosa]|uniref:acetyl-CoA carboxytransferase n=1 Tax=Oldenlandia corymbosa var. corymbosa TaxID=529605 RepID=A0AAV1DRT2_OLDCO|nr:OLC1v1009295C1 [Oldenlandia corymbosa var. corymbosa]
MMMMMTTNTLSVITATVAATAAAAATSARRRGEENSIVLRVLLCKKKSCGRVRITNVEGTTATAMIKKHGDDDDDDDEDPFKKYLHYFETWDDPASDEERDPMESFPGPLHELDGKIRRAERRFNAAMTPIQRLSFATHPNRPTFVDHLSMVPYRVDLGDEANDPPILTALGMIRGELYPAIMTVLTIFRGQHYVFIGYHHKAASNMTTSQQEKRKKKNRRNKKEKNIKHTVAIPTPRCYKRALLMMKYAERYGFPIVNFVDTTSAFPGLESEELGQEEVITHDLRVMFGLKVPIITIVTGEGGSGGVLAMACANKLLMMENSAFHVRSLEACSEMMQKLSSGAREEAEMLSNVTTPEHYRLRIAGGVIEEAHGGAHYNPLISSLFILMSIRKVMKELKQMDAAELISHRMLKFHELGEKPALINVQKTAVEIESQLEELKMKIIKAKGIVVPTPTHWEAEKLSSVTAQEHYRLRIAGGVIEEPDGAAHDNHPISTVFILNAIRKVMELRYLIVQDDIWNVEAWECIKQSFPDDNNGSRIIFTSRIHNFVSQAKPINSSIHPLRPLSDGESWDLLEGKLSRHHGFPLDEELSNIAKHIAKNCKGLPLSVVLVAGILAGKDREFWKHIECGTSSQALSEEFMDAKTRDENILPWVNDNDVVASGSSQNPGNSENYVGLCIDAHRTKFVDIKSTSPFIRSLVLIRGQWYTNACLSTIFNSFRLLNVLDLESIVIDGPFPEEWPDSSRITECGRPWRSVKWNRFLAFPCSLKKLTLGSFYFPWSEISMMKELPNLEVLKLRWSAFSGESWHVEDGEFLKLKYLELDHSDIEEWSVEDDPFPSLEQLILMKCTRLVGIPSCLGYITTLKKIEMHEGDRASSSAREIYKEQQDMGNDFLEVVIDGESPDSSRIALNVERDIMVPKLPG